MTYFASVTGRCKSNHQMKSKLNFMRYFHVNQKYFDNEFSFNFRQSHKNWFQNELPIIIDIGYPLETCVYRIRNFVLIRSSLVKLIEGVCREFSEVNIFRTFNFPRFPCLWSIIRKIIPVELNLCGDLCSFRKWILANVSFIHLGWKEFRLKKLWDFLRRWNCWMNITWNFRNEISNFYSLATLSSSGGSYSFSGYFQISVYAKYNDAKLA